MDNKNYINVYDDVLEPGQCQHLVDKFEDSKHQWIKTELKSHRSFTEININLHSDWQEYVDIVYKVLKPYVDKYCEDNDIDRLKQWPNEFGFEQSLNALKLEQKRRAEAKPEVEEEVEAEA